MRLMGMDAARIAQAVNASIEQIKQWISPLTIIKKVSAWGYFEPRRRRLFIARRECTA